MTIDKLSVHWNSNCVRIWLLVFVWLYRKCKYWHERSQKCTFYTNFIEIARILGKANSYRPTNFLIRLQSLMVFIKRKSQTVKNRCAVAEHRNSNNTNDTDQQHFQLLFWPERERKSKRKMCFCLKSYFVIDTQRVYTQRIPTFIIVIRSMFWLPLDMFFSSLHVFIRNCSSAATDFFIVYISLFLQRIHVFIRTCECVWYFFCNSKCKCLKHCCTIFQFDSIYSLHLPRLALHKASGAQTN